MAICTSHCTALPYDSCSPPPRCPLPLFAASLLWMSTLRFPNQEIRPASRTAAPTGPPSLACALYLYVSRKHLNGRPEDGGDPASCLPSRPPCIRALFACSEGQYFHSGPVQLGQQGRLDSETCHSLPAARYLENMQLGSGDPTPSKSLQSANTDEHGYGWPSQEMPALNSVRAPTPAPILLRLLCRRVP
ncbi:hypothetical protein MAPG_05491 [Magnaporthiopsis poae ATCC 64411]|uniref:Uncharacterized protein n=1 Tax=Magnaporthiopsis poae (strain ATCC 64411 / 73-15) TaxID=644358 RepID=A0A0C4DZI9_MAGP6|nr:hypothetical protein MAPG_05491 [Magnaporthiopsis poae ATCC 64411]